MQKCNSCGTINSDMYCKVCKKELDQNNSYKLDRIDITLYIIKNIKRLFLMFYHKFKIGYFIEKIKVLFALFSEVKEVKFVIPGSHSSIGEKKDIIIPFKKNKLIFPFLGTIIFIVLCIILLFTEINPPFIKIVFVIGIIFFGYIGIYAFNRLFDKKPGLIINEEGIIDNSSAISTGILIKWENITNIKRMWMINLVIEVNNADEIISYYKPGFKKLFVILNKDYIGSPVIILLNTLDCNSQDLYNIIKLKSDDFIRKNNEAIVEVENNVYTKSEKPSFCSQCGSKIESDNAKFCNNCGNKINQGAFNNLTLNKINYSREKLSNNMGNNNMLVYIAFFGLIISFFIPFISMQDFSISFIDLIDKVSENLSTVLGEKMINFMTISILTGFSILLGYVNRGKILSLLGLFGIYVYIKFILGVNEYIKTIDKIINDFQGIFSFGYQNDIITNDTISNIIYSSPGTIIYVLANIVLMFAGIHIILSYFKMLNKSQ